MGYNEASKILGETMKSAILLLTTLISFSAIGSNAEIICSSDCRSSNQIRCIDNLNKRLNIYRDSYTQVSKITYASVLKTDFNGEPHPVKSTMACVTVLTKKN